MWYTWFTLLLVSCALVQAEERGDAGPVTKGTGQVTEETGPVGGVTDQLGDAHADVDKRSETIIHVDASQRNEAVDAGVTVINGPVATTRPPPRTLDRQGAELAWRTWLQSPENGNTNGPARRITTKSLFITPLICPKGQRLDREACVQVKQLFKHRYTKVR